MVQGAVVSAISHSDTSVWSRWELSVTIDVDEAVLEGLRMIIVIVIMVVIMSRLS